MSHSKEINTTNMNDLEEGEISNEKIINQEKNIIAHPTSFQFRDDQSDEDDESQGFFNKLKASPKKEEKAPERQFINQKRTRSFSPQEDQYNYPKKTFNKYPKQTCQYYSANGYCTKGNDCRFAHETQSALKYSSNYDRNNNANFNSQQYRDSKQYQQQQGFNRNYKRDLCKYYVNGSCLKGDNCSFSHTLKDFPCKYYQVRGYCDNKDICKFSHKKLHKEEMMKFIKDNEQFIEEMKEKGKETKIDLYYNEYLDNKNNITQGSYLPQYNNNNKSNNFSNIMPTQPMGQQWVNMPMNISMNSQMFHQPQMKNMMMNYPIYNAPVLPPNMQFYPMAMNLNVNMPGHNQFIPHSMVNNNLNTDTNNNKKSLPLNYQENSNSLSSYDNSKPYKKSSKENSSDRSNRSQTKSNQSQHYSEKNNEESIAKKDITSTPEEEEVDDEIEVIKTEDEINENQESIISEVKNNLNQNTNNKEELLKKIVDVLKQNAPKDPRQRK